MNTTNFEQLYQNLQSNVESLAKSLFSDYVSHAKRDGQKALEGVKENLQRWVTEVESGAINKEDLEFLINGEKSLNEMKSLKQAGLAAIQIDKFKQELLDMIIGTVTNVVKL